MNLLTAALPGVREIRAPLVSGYLWLLLAWLVCDPGRDFGSVTGTGREVVDLGQTIGPIATGVAVSVAAFLIGSINQPVSVWIANRWRNAFNTIWSLGPVVLPYRWAPPWGAPDPLQETRTFTPRITSEAGERTFLELESITRLNGELGAKMSAFVDDHRRRASGESTLTAAYRAELTRRRDPEGPESAPAALVARLDRYDRSLVRTTWEEVGIPLRRMQDDIAAAEALFDRLSSAPDLRDRVWAQLVEAARACADDTFAQISIPATLLLGDDPMAFAEADRDRAESELRLGVALPLLVLAGYLAWTTSPFWLISIPAVIVLVVQGLLRADASKQFIATTVAHRNIPLDAAERFCRAVAEASAAHPADASPRGGVR